MDDFYFSIPSFSPCLGDLKPLMLKVISEQCILIEVIMLLFFFLFMIAMLFCVFKNYSFAFFLQS